MLRAHVDLMVQKLKENNIDFDEHLDIRLPTEEDTRSNSPTIGLPSSGLASERVTKGLNKSKTHSENNFGATMLSGERSDDKRLAGLDSYNPTGSLYGFSKSRRLGNQREEIKVDK